MLVNHKLLIKKQYEKQVKAEGKFVRQSGGRGQYGHCWIELIPTTEPYSFENATVGGSIPREYIAPIETGIKEASQSGILGGYPVLNFKVKSS